MCQLLLNNSSIICHEGHSSRAPDERTIANRTTPPHRRLSTVFSQFLYQGAISSSSRRMVFAKKLAYISWSAIMDVQKGALINFSRSRELGSGLHLKAIYHFHRRRRWLFVKLFKWSLPKTCASVWRSIDTNVFELCKNYAMLKEAAEKKNKQSKRKRIGLGDITKGVQEFYDTPLLLLLARPRYVCSFFVFVFVLCGASGPMEGQKHCERHATFAAQEMHGSQRFLGARFPHPMPVT